MCCGVFCPMSVSKTCNVIPAGHQFYNHWHFKTCQPWEGRSLPKGQNQRRLKAFIKTAGLAETHALFDPDW